MMSSPLTTLRNALLSLILGARSHLLTLRPLVVKTPAGPDKRQVLGQVPGDDTELEASPAPATDVMSDHTPGPAPEPLSAPETVPAAAPGYIAEPAEQLASVLIPMPPQPRCQYPTDCGHDWMLSHRFKAADGGFLVCQDCGEVFPRPRGEARA